MQGFRDMEGLVAVVTGAASGIGEATARTLTERGAIVYGFDLGRGDGQAVDRGIIADVTDSSAVERAVGEVVRREGRLDICVNNAGVGAVGTVADNTIEEWRRVFEVNVLGIVRLTSAALEHLRRSPAGAIVNTCSVAADVGLPMRALYSATKGAVVSLTRAMAADHLRDGIRVNGVSPGTADTPWVTRLVEQSQDPLAERAALEARQPLGRLVSAQEVADAIAYLASPRSGATTGTVLVVDGGLTGLRLPVSTTS